MDESPSKSDRATGTETEEEKLPARSESANQDGGPEDPQEIIEKLQKSPQLIREVFMAVMKGGGPMYPPFLDKVDKDHITHGIEIMKLEATNRFEDGRSKRKYNMAYFVTGVLLFIFLTVYLVTTGNKDVFFEILKTLGAFAAGGVGGYGLSEVKRQSE